MLKNVIILLLNSVHFSSFLFTCLLDNVMAKRDKNSGCGENMNVLAGHHNVKLCGLYLITLYGNQLCHSILCPRLKRKWNSTLL